MVVRRSLRVLAAAGAAALAAGAPVAGEPPAGAEERPAAVRALARFLEGAQVGPAAEHRFLVVHPVLVPPAGEPDPGAPGLAASLAPDVVGLPAESRGARPEARIAGLGTRTAWFLPGDLLRLGDGDFALAEDVAVPAGATTTAPLVRVSRAPDAGAAREEPRRVGSMPGPALLWTVLAERPSAVLDACADLAREVKCGTARESPAELAAAATIAARVREYRSRLGTLRRPPGAGRREVAGYVAVLDGGFAAFEVFADRARFEAVWQERIEGLAVEASVLELENEALDAPIPAPDDPDRFVSAAKDAILGIYGLDPKPVRAEGLGQVLRLATGADTGRAVLDEAGAPQHVLWLRDPARRHASPGTEGDAPLDPGVISRKFRPTEFERRWLERRKNRLPPQGQ